MNPVRIVVADDHDVVRSGFASLLDTRPEFTVVGTAQNGLEAVRLGRELQPDVILMDIRMPGIDGIQATRQLTGHEANRPRILILTTFDLDEYVYDALRAGASGFLLKDVTAEQLFEAVRVIAAGDALLAPGVTRRLISEFAQRPTATTQPTPALQELTRRETQVLRHVAEGLSNSEIADRLVVTEEPVKTHVSRILNKLGLRDRTQAVGSCRRKVALLDGSSDRGWLCDANDTALCITKSSPRIACLGDSGAQRSRIATRGERRSAAALESDTRQAVTRATGGYRSSSRPQALCAQYAESSSKARSGLRSWGGELAAVHGSRSVASYAIAGDPDGRRRAEVRRVAGAKQPIPSLDFELQSVVGFALQTL